MNIHNTGNDDSHHLECWHSSSQIIWWGSNMLQPLFWKEIQCEAAGTISEDKRIRMNGDSEPSIWPWSNLFTIVMRQWWFLPNCFYHFFLFFFSSLFIVTWSKHWGNFGGLLLCKQPLRLYIHRSIYENLLNGSYWPWTHEKAYLSLPWPTPNEMISGFSHDLFC